MQVKRIFTLLIIAVSLLCYQSPLKAMNYAADTAIVILPTPGTNPGPDGPRSPAFIPISAYYDSSVSSVLLSFKSNLGEIEVEVLNSSTGGYSSTFVDTQFLYSAIPITLGSGHYIITFTLPSGQQYQGEFDVN